MEVQRQKEINRKIGPLEGSLKKEEERRKRLGATSVVVQGRKRETDRRRTLEASP